MSAAAPLPNPRTARALSAGLLAWYDRHGRRLPWRLRPEDRAAGGRPDPYAVWLSEAMAQQTTLAAVKPYHAAFLARWPKVEDLAAAPREEVLAAWAGLGYYARARNLHAAAQKLAAEGFPRSEAAWREIPGVGPYTAAALAAILDDEPAVVVDGNVERVMARLFAMEEPLPKGKPALRALAAALTPQERPGDYAQAVMDLGATICRPRDPDCAPCPWREPCAGRKRGIAAQLPRKTPKAPRPERRGAVFAALRPDGAILLTRRPEKGLLGGMLEIPGTDWTPLPPEAEARRAAAPLALAWRRIGEIRQIFTHFSLILDVYAAEAADPRALPQRGIWTPMAEAQAALPGVMRKALTLVREAREPPPLWKAAASPQETA
ncbi:A/G-specific adenine glycosylase [Neomegalonema perideroedes]|uniref:A/G-specific adenine glycosylase n=1 Tax=Neomegalonema perideroedes TaxID=217219 RepID=UPI00036826A2|nr:A/G-specific adenine glycosylase [Neomegalonema perideroedes]